MADLVDTAVGISSLLLKFSVVRSSRSWIVTGVLGWSACGHCLCPVFSHLSGSHVGIPSTVLVGNRCPRYHSEALGSSHMCLGFKDGLRLPCKLLMTLWLLRLLGGMLSVGKSLWPHSVSGALGFPGAA